MEDGVGYKRFGLHVCGRIRRTILALPSTSPPSLPNLNRPSPVPRFITVKDVNDRTGADGHHVAVDWSFVVGPRRATNALAAIHVVCQTPTFRTFKHALVSHFIRHFSRVWFWQDEDPEWQ